MKKINHVCKRATRSVLITWLIYADRCWSIGTIKFARDRMSFTHERGPGNNNGWCPEVHDTCAWDCDHVMLSQLHWIGESMRGSVGVFHESTGKRKVWSQHIVADSIVGLDFFKLLVWLNLSTHITWLALLFKNLNYLVGLPLWKVQARCLLHHCGTMTWIHTWCHDCQNALVGTVGCQIYQGQVWEFVKKQK